LPFRDLRLRAPKPLGKNYPTELRSIGDRMRKRRLDLGMTQKETARCIGVSLKTLEGWERGRTRPGLQAVPRVHEFLEFKPEPPAFEATLGERLQAARRSRGLSRERLAQELRVDPSTIRNWELGRSTPRVRHRARILELAGTDPGPEPAQPSERLRAYRERRGLTQEELGDRLRVSQSAISDWERGRSRPDPRRPGLAVRIGQSLAG
jgi:transcriptional regulator with XRE-family HTH domain